MMPAGVIPSLGPEQIRQRCRALMPEVIENLRALVGHASVAFPGFPSRPVEAMGHAVVDLMRRSGFGAVRMLDLGSPYPAVYADVPGPPGSPTVLLYAHYDVQPAPLDAGWETDPWTLTERGGRLYGRGAADDKSGIVMHAATMRLFDGRPPVGIRLVIEGEEETLSHLGAFVDANPDQFRADAYVIADNGNLVAGQPVLTTTLRGEVVCSVETRTLHHPVHSGEFGGVAPDALIALIHILSGLWDDGGRTVVPGVRGFDWRGAQYPEDLFRANAAIQAGVGLAGSGTVSTRLWSQPSATVTGLDAPSVAEAANVLIPRAKARVAMRIAPRADAKRELQALMGFLRSRAPSWAQVDVTQVSIADPFEVRSEGQGLEAARAALREAYRAPPSEIGGGGSIPVLRSLQHTSPHAGFVLWGAQDLQANIHGPNESVDPAEIEKMIVSQALFLELLSHERPEGDETTSRA
jgi:acetylornithine deacetylase/succinyl-diaminopimelate desuccinylase-like protein